MAYGPTNAPGVDGAELEQIRNTAAGAVPATTTVNGKPLSGNITLTAADVGAVPAGRKVNGKPLRDDVSLTAPDVGAVPASEKGAVNGVATLDGSGKVPTGQLPSLCPFAAGRSAPADTLKLWIDTTPNTGGLKYFNGSAWVPVPVSYT